MKIPALFLRVCLLCSICVAIVSAAVLEGKPSLAQSEFLPAQPVAQPPTEIVIPELGELRNQLRMMELSNEEMQKSSVEARAKWEAMMQQNAALSNVLTGLQQTLITQKE
ncbi:MAG: hypothetical protein ACXW3L_09060, partial [Limisphaerales bacterium]